LSFPFGKISPTILERIVFKYLGVRRADIVQGPAKGEDAAIVRIGRNLLALSCDPISGALRRIGWLVLNVSANDVATRGVKPRWFLSTMMLPKGTRTNFIKRICREMDQAAIRLNIGIVGGHSEITPGIDHPLIIGFCVGVVEKKGYVTTSMARKDDEIILTKGVGIEGTAILASDRRKMLMRSFDREFLRRAESFYDRISVVKEALAAFNLGGVSAMHDPTEGGVAGGLHELADASGKGFEVYEETLTSEPETLEICRFFKIDPLRLISSGSLLITCLPKMTDKILSKLHSMDIRASSIGKVTASRDRVIVKKSGVHLKLQRPLSDHLWIALSRRF